MSSCFQGVIQGAFEIGKKFWVHQDWHLYFDKLMKKKYLLNLILTLITIKTKSINLPPTCINYWKPTV